MKLYSIVLIIAGICLYSFTDDCNIVAGLISGVLCGLGFVGLLLTITKGVLK